MLVFKYSGAYLKQQLTIIALVSSLAFVLSLWLLPSHQTAVKQLNVPAMEGGKVFLPTFQEQSIEAGLDFSHTQLTDHLGALTETLGSGGCILDFDNDGLMDLFLVGGTGHTWFYGKHSWWHQQSGHALFHNTTTEIDSPRFTNIIKQSGIAEQSWGMGCTAGDLNNDGFDEILITNKGKNLLYRNNTDGTFSDVSEDAGLSNQNWSTSAAMADYDGDGLLDIYVANYIDFTKGAVTFEQDRGFKSSSPAAFQAELFNAQANQLYHNQGDFKFVERAKELGVANSAGRSLAVVWLDLDGDQDQDLLVINDKGSPTQLFVFNGKTFKQTNTVKQFSFPVESSNGSRSAIIGDWDNNGFVDAMLTSQTALPNKLLLFNPRTQKYEDLTWETNITDDQNVGLSGWGGISADFNNDGWLDLLVNNGLATPDPDIPLISQGQGARMWLHSRNAQFGIPRFMQYVPFSSEHSLKQWPLLSGRSALRADFDNDGDIDFVLLQNNDPVQLMVNRSPRVSLEMAGDDAPKMGNWLGVKLINQFGNSGGEGVRLSLENGSQTLLRSSAEQYGFLSRSDNRLHFGLGDLTNQGKHKPTIDKLTVHWADGQLSELRSVPINQYIAIRQGSSGYTNIRPSLGEKKNEVQDMLESIPKEWRNNVADYYHWLLKKEASKKVIRMITAQLSLMSAEERAQMYKVVLQNDDFALIGVAKQALLEKEDELRVLAIRWFERTEIEDSALWLIERLNDKSEQVACASANAFTTFFREEEAMVRRKLLSLPVLIQLLENNSSPIVLCTLEALAESEHYRAVDPVVRLLSHREIEIRVAAIETLGRLRQRKPEKDLRHLLANDATTADERAAIFVALSRLDSKVVDELLKNQLSHQPTNEDISGIRHAVMFVESVLLAQDGVVIKSKVLNLFEELITSQSSRWIKQQLNPMAAADMARLFNILAMSQSPRLLELLKPFLMHRNVDIRRAAYLALTQAKTTQASNLLLIGLQDSDDKIQNKVIDIFGDSGSELPSDELRNYLQRHTNPPSALRSRLLLLVRRSHQQVAIDFIQNSINIAKPTDEFIKLALLACQLFPAAGIYVKEELFIQSTQLLRAEAVACQFLQLYRNTTSAANNSEHKAVDLIVEINRLLNIQDSETTAVLVRALTRSSLPSSQKILLKMVKSESIPIQIITQTLETVAASAHKSTLLVLLAASTNNRIGIRAVALKLLVKFAKNNKVPDKFWRVLGDPKESMNIRLIAADFLFNTEPDKVITALDL